MANINGTNLNDNLNGTPEADVINAGAGNDTIDGGEGDDTLYGGDGNDTLAGGLGNDRIITGNGVDTVYGGDGDDEINGYPSDPLNKTGEYKFWNSDGPLLVYGERGNDFIVGSSSSDTLDGGEGDDTLYGGDGNDTLDGGEGDDRLFGGDGDNKLYGGLGKDYLSAYLKKGANYLDGGEGDDTLYGGDGNDTLLGGLGNDRLDGDAGNDTLDGGEGDDTLYGGDGNDTLLGGSGYDYLAGGNGDDTYLITDRNFYIYDQGGNDKALVSVSFVKIPSSIEQVVYVDSAMPLPYWIDALIPDTGNGTRYVDEFLASAKTFKYIFPSVIPSYDTSVDRAKGYTQFNQTQKQNTVIFLQYLATIIDLSFIETINADQRNTFSFATNNQTDSGGYAVYPNTSSTGSDVFLNNKDYNQTLNTGTYGANVLVHEIGHALGLKHPFSAKDVDSEIADPPYLTGSEDHARWTVMSYTRTTAEYTLTLSPLDIAALHYIYGVSPAARSGNDTYVLSSSWPNFLWDGNGIDTVDASKLSQRVTIYLEPGYWGFVGSEKTEKITAPGQITINFGTLLENIIGTNFSDELHGNNVANEIAGGAGNDLIYGKGGNDVLSGGAGNDILYGGDGDDTFDWNPNSRSGDDTFYGGKGNDTFVIDSAFDTIVENESEGIDTVWTSVSYSIAGLNNVENILGFGPVALVLTGNSKDNDLKGGSGNDTLDGGPGNDLIQGWDGNDTLIGGQGDDQLIGGAGIDTAQFSSFSGNYKTSLSDKIFSVKDNRGVGDGVDSLNGVERIKFTDTSVAIDLDGNAGITARILGAVVGKQSLTNKEYVGIGLDLLDKGMSYSALAALALEAVGLNSNDKIVTALWTNVIGLAPTAAEKAPFVNMLENGFSRGELAKLAAETQENAANIGLVGLAQTGIEYLPAS